MTRIIGESHRGRCHEIGVSGLNANERFVYNEQALSTDGGAMLRLWPQHRNMAREFDTLAPCDSRWFVASRLFTPRVFQPFPPAVGISARINAVDAMQSYGRFTSFADGMI